MKKTVTVVAQRHGKKASGFSNNEAPMSPEGFEQVAQAARNNFLDYNFQHFFISEKLRALQCCTTAVSVLPGANKGKSIIARHGFDYTHAPLDQYEVRDAIVRQRVDAGEPESVAMWLEVYPEMCECLKSTFRNEVEKAIWELEESHELEGDIYIGSHGQTCELNAIDPATMPILKEADAIEYVFELETESYEIALISSHYIPRGF